MEKFLKQKKGITLIALVITIIVLLILAGISISMITGQNGILNRAGDAKILYEESSFKEQLEIEVLGNNMNKNGLNVETLKARIEKNVDNVEIMNDEIPLLVKNKKTNYIYLIDNDGSVMLYDENAVARIKDKFYETLQLAINAVPADNNEKEIILLKDISENVSIPQNKKIILNLNNKTINSGDQTAINSSGFLIIKGGTVKSEKKHALYNQGSTIVDNALLTSSSTGIETITNTANSNLTILNSTIESKNQNSIYTYGGSNTLITGNSTQIISKKDCISSAGELTIDGGDFYSEVRFAVYARDNSNIKINKGIFNNGRSDLWPGVVQLDGTGTITIGNIGDNNDDILINNNDNRNICGIGLGGDGGTTLIINSGSIRGYDGIDMAVKNSKLYLNGGTIVGTGGTAGSGTGWSVTLNSANGNTTNVNIYLKNNSGVSLSGRGLSGKNSIRWTQYVTEVD